MDRESWRAAKELFGRCLGASRRDRERWLADANGEVAREVASLLVALTQAGGFLGANGNSSVDQARLDQVDRPPAPPGPGDRVGPFVLQTEIGRGGMGAVFLAERADATFRQILAVKVIAASTQSTATQRRFRVERQALAALTHPNIALLVDGGATESGLLYLAMEHVEGEPLLDYCRTRSLSVNDRLRLFMELCSAVQFAHQNLVLHCDLKPANVLVRDDGTPKLLDFGIAKLLGGTAAGWEATETSGARPLTPAYASPEQLRGRRLTTATDVYSLGLLLFHLLAGRHPHAEFLDDPIELLRSVERHTLVAPSEIAAAPLRHQLAGDLDCVVLKAMSQEPAHRYRSAADLASDLECYLDGLPVVARGTSRLYRAAKLVRRHILATLTAVSLLLLSVTFTVQRFQISREIGQKIEERQRAEASMEFFRAVLAEAVPDLDQGQDVKVGELLEPAARRLIEEASEREPPRARAGTRAELSPRQRADLLLFVGEILGDVGSYETAGEALELAVQLRRMPSSEQPEELATALVACARLLRVRGGNIPRARELLEEAFALRASTHGLGHVSVAQVHFELGALDRRDHKLASAVTHLEAATRIFELHPGQHRLVLGDTLRTQAVIEIDRQAGAPALELLDRADHVDPPDLELWPTRAALALALRGNGYQFVGQWSLAEKTLVEALRIKRRVLPAGHPSLAGTLGNLAGLQYRLQHLESAEMNFIETLEILERYRASNHANLAERTYNLGMVLHDQGRFNEADELYSQALTTHRSIEPPSQPRILAIQHRRALLRADRGDLKGGLSDARQVLVQRRALPTGNGLSVASSLAGIADLLERSSRQREAEAAWREALTIRRAKLSQFDPRTALTMARLGGLLAIGGCGHEALELTEQAIHGMRLALSLTDSRLATAEDALARCASQGS